MREDIDQAYQEGTEGDELDTFSVIEDVDMESGDEQ